MLRLSLLMSLWTVGVTPEPPRFGSDGHMIVCQLAYDVLTQPARAEVQRLTRLYRRPDGYGFAAFADACPFADRAGREARDGTPGWEDHAGLGAWHYLNVPRGTRRVEAEHCPEACVLSAITHHRTRLADYALDDQTRAEALFYLAHWVGDLHQPLHVSFEDDRGGNDIAERGLYGRPLHSVWDTGIIERAKRGSDWTALARSLATTLPLPGSTDPLVWAQESYDLAVHPALQYCRWTVSDRGESCARLGPDRTFDADYQTEFEDDVLLRLQLAAVRLAALLERILVE